MLGQLNRSFELLRSRARGLAASAQQDISEVLNREGEIRNQLLALRDKRMSGSRIRNHGDYHLSNVLFSGSDWIITNFEGDPNRSLSERRIKRSALRDVATIMRSFHYVAHAALFGDVPGIVPAREADPQLERWARTWYQWVSQCLPEGIPPGCERPHPSCRNRPTSSKSCWVLTCWNAHWRD